MALVYLGLGSNLGDRLSLLEAALDQLEKLGTVTTCSSVYETAPWGVADQAAFLNLCCALETTSQPGELLASVKAIEEDLGRLPGPRWGPRPVDIDLLVWGDLAIDTAQLRIPHPRLTERAFVLAPLAEIAPDLIPPGQARTIRDLLDNESIAAQLVRRVGQPLR
jgi:2-amino-4-hydroxy-6-hydroxymethyldihydropteridine diphosphokinase